MVDIEEFKKKFMEVYLEHLNNNLLRQEMKQTISNISLIKQCISKSNDSKNSYPIIVGNVLSRASVTNIGTFPPYKYNEMYIYPNNYTVKKRFKAHKNYKKSINNKVLYLCKIGNDGITITSDDGYVWKGQRLWDEFKEDVGIVDEFKDIEDFMALNHPLITKMIEEIGDISLFEKYIPLAKRIQKE